MRSFESSDLSRQKRLQQEPGLGEGPGCQCWVGGRPTGRVLQAGAPSGGVCVNGLRANELGTQNGQDSTV